jgi:hypothetical protein
MAPFYRPEAPSDGFGHIQLTPEQCSNRQRLERGNRIRRTLPRRRQRKNILDRMRRLPNRPSIHVMTDEAAAIKIGRLFRKAKDAMGGSVTHLRHFSGKMSGSRNADRSSGERPEVVTMGWLAGQPSSGDVCYYCGKRFAPDQLRYRVMQAVASGWGPALLCMDCFKSENDDSVLGYGAIRHIVQCAGCREYINTIRNPRHQHWKYCSIRCYQRQYRKRRRGRDSVVDWKAHRPNNWCAVCKKPLDQFGKQHRRKNAVYCSSKCRQWAYRRRTSRP